MMYHCRLEGSYSNLFVPSYRIDHWAEQADHVIDRLEDNHQAVLLTYFGAIEPRIEDMIKVFKISQKTYYNWLNNAVDQFDTYNKVA